MPTSIPSTRPSRSPTPVAINDFNKDGKLDILVADFFSDDVSVLINNREL